MGLRNENIALAAVAFESALLLLAWGIGALVDVSPLRTLRFSWLGAGVGVVATVPLLVGLWWSIRSSWAVIQRLTALVEEHIVPLFANATLPQIVAVSLVAGLGEEALFRGVIQGWLELRVGPPIAIAATGAMFGMVHMISPAYAILAGVMGVYLGWLMVVSGNLLVPVTVHALYDFVALMYLLRWRDRGAGLSSEETAI